ncbi:lipopolysaccharide core heptose(I) kinase RfaP [Oceanicoccus sp. KOV_DT_Chl]|uniref:lipopolysaccharide core heptose(I) kinase RfaP n=1 Tax=Oceanicoccus sp. KOV_DT_Chl TaxID=1904639 RepID=UPI000C7A6827|nr:lipopolysaccharide core heptose(I) kinase RfaP [Oceanicoccus sp. KOV_DT_Chl]
MKLFLRDEFKRLWQGKDPFCEVQKIKGDIYRNKEGRTTSQVTIAGRSYFLKVHTGIGWNEIFKNIVQFRLPVIGASNEYLAAKKLTDLGVSTLTTAAFGKRGWNPAKQLSFILTDDLNNTISLEDYCAAWQEAPPEYKHRIALVRLLASVSRTMHKAGINHRDYYICHFLLEKNNAAEPDNPRCYLIDLHRAQMRREVPERWAIKDIAGLYFSAMNIGLTKRDCLRFMKIYGDGNLRQLDTEFWKKVNSVALKLYQKDHGKESPCSDWWLTD